jgi:hypothetical protein
MRRIVGEDSLRVFERAKANLAKIFSKAIVERLDCRNFDAGKRAPRAFPFVRVTTEEPLS